jgi:ABC-type Na+ efflux pump permease subunit
MPERSQDRVESVRVRRAPKISVFLILGAALGVLVAMILTFAFNGTAEVSPNTGMEYSPGQVFGFLMLICVPVGLALAGVVALILDRRSRRHTHEVAVDHTSVQVDPEPGTEGRGASN